MKPIFDSRAQNSQCSVDVDAIGDLAKLEYGEEAHVALRVGPKPDHSDYVGSNFGRVVFYHYHEIFIQIYSVKCTYLVSV
jgi:hypothetical protein